jgi:hypothetical protein
VHTPFPNVSAGMQRLNSVYAQGFNRRYGRRGHVLESRFWSDLVEDDRQLLAVVRYVHLNPLAAGACDAPEDWLWSSYRATAGYVPRPRLLNDDALLGLISDDRAKAQLEWREIVAAAISRGEHRKPREERPAKQARAASSHSRSGVRPRNESVTQGSRVRNAATAATPPRRRRRRPPGRARPPPAAAG